MREGRGGGGVGLDLEIIGYTGSSRCRYPIALVPLSALRPHERVIGERLEALIEDLSKRGVILKPILVDAKTLVILDGHHRVEALRALGKPRVPAVMVDYDDDKCIQVGSWREGWRVTKELVRERGVKGKLLPPRPSRHKPLFPVPDVSLPLSML